MKRFLEILQLVVVILFPTSCVTTYYDTIPSEVAAMTIPLLLFCQSKPRN